MHRCTNGTSAKYFTQNVSSAEKKSLHLGLLFAEQGPFLMRGLPSLVSAGLTWEECASQCPQGVVPACHNAEDTVTISGPQVRLLILCTTSLQMGTHQHPESMSAK